MENEGRRRVARIIKVARAEMDITQAQLAEALGVSVTTVGEYERGIKQKFSLAEAIALETALGITDRRLLLALGYEPAPDPEAGRNTFSYAGDPLGPQEEREVLEFVDWVRARRGRR